MNSLQDGGAFSGAPLITRDRLEAEHDGAFMRQPLWMAESLRYVHHDGKVELRLSGKWPLDIRLARTGRAVAAELTRLEGRLVSNPRKAESTATRYPRLLYSDAPEALVPFIRILVGADIGEAVRTIGMAHEITPENAALEDNASAKRNARELAVPHAERIARKWETEGRLPRGFDVAAYVANLWDLLALVDEEAASGGPVVEVDDPYEGEGVLVEAGQHFRADNTLDFAKLNAELLANLAHGVADIDAATREHVKARISVSDQFIDHHLRDTVAGWLARIDGRMSERRKSRMSAPRA